ncbi:MAG: VanW family protein [Lachnospiraceae bacterium]|nr:VanW family protein [Lachnospiraceae bacterium]
MNELERGRRTAGQSRAKGHTGSSRRSSAASGGTAGSGRSTSGSHTTGRRSTSGSGSRSSRPASRSTARSSRSTGYRSYSSKRRSGYRRGSGGNWWMVLVGVVLFVAVVSIVFAVKGKQGGKEGSAEASGTTAAQETTMPETELVREVSVNGISITGMNQTAAKQVLLDAYPWSMQIQNGEERYPVGNLLEQKIDGLLAQIYSDEKPEEAYTLDTAGLEEAAAAEAAALAQAWDKKAKNGSISSFDKDSGKFVFSGAESGVEVDQEKTAADILAALSQQKFDAVIPATLRQVAPEFDEASARERYKTVSTFTTNTTANSKRNTNIRLASQAIDGHVLQPGEEFSFNDVVGPRTEAKGYQPAAAYNNGEVVQEYGGGVCQVSTTLYNAVLQAGLKTTVRRSHTYEPSYVTPGMDATVSYGGPDYKFVNNSDTAVGIRASYGNQVVTVSIYAIPILESGVKYSLKSEKLKDADPPAPVYEEDQTLQPGEEKVKSKGSIGSQWETRLVVTKNGEVVSQEVDHRTSYKGHAPVILRNTSGVVVPAEGAETTPAETIIPSEGAGDGIVPGTEGGSTQPGAESTESSEASGNNVPGNNGPGTGSEEKPKAPSEAAEPTIAPNTGGPGGGSPAPAETISGQAPGAGGPGGAGGGENVVAPNPLGNQ